MLYRLLKSIPATRYSLVSIKDYDGQETEYDATKRLPGHYYKLHFARQVPVRYFPWLSKVRTIVNFFWQVMARAIQIRRIVRKENSGLLIPCTGDFYDLPASYVASRWTGVPLAPYIFDDYAYQWIGINREISRRVERIILKHAKEVAVPNEYMQREYRTRHGVESFLIRNPCIIPDLDELDAADRVFSKGAISIVYTGAIYHAHYDAFRNMVSALDRIDEPDVKLHLFTVQTVAELESHGICGPKVVCHPHVESSEVPKIIRQADILFLPLAFESPIPEVIRTSAPGKIGEYLAVGRPVLVHAPGDSFVSWFIRENGCGVVVGERDPAVLSNAIAGILSDASLRISMGERARALARKEFDVTIMQARFLEFVERSIS